MGKKVIYHVTKTKSTFENIIRERLLRPGKNVVTGEALVHVMLAPPVPGGWALDVIGEDTNQAWVLELEVPDETPLLQDPSDEGEDYGGQWYVAPGPVPILAVRSVLFVPNVQAWEMGREEWQELPLQG